MRRHFVGCRINAFLGRKLGSAAVLPGQADKARPTAE